jgi:hypothetical protein
LEIFMLNVMRFRNNESTGTISKKQ